MEKNINVAIHSLRQELQSVIGSSQLPVSVVQLVVNELASMVNVQANEIMRNEVEQYEKSINEEEIK